jgi:hypothetical protein
VPEGDGLGTGETNGALGVTVVERAGEGDDADAHQTAAFADASRTLIDTTSSITELENISSA